MIVYIDGFNLYFGIKEAGWKQYLWLDLLALARNLLLEHQDIVGVKYFTSRISGPGPKQARQSDYLDALGTLDPSLFSTLFGKYQQEPRTCPLCGGRDMISHEKMTDVNIAVEMMRDAFQDRFDAALLLSADADLCPPVRMIRQLFPAKRVVAGFPPRRRSAELVNVASSHFVIGKGSLAKSQFAPEVVTSSGTILRRPKTWIAQGPSQELSSAS